MDVLQMRPDRSDRLAFNATGPASANSKGDISKPRSSFCACDVIFDMRSAYVTSKRLWWSEMFMWITLRSGAGFNVTRRNSVGVVGENCG